jgi:hypothetical protein
MTQKTTIENQTRQQIAEFLPEAIELTVTSYKKFMRDGPKEKTENSRRTGSENAFTDHHKSAKIAISHIELLIKLAKWADLPDQEIIGEKGAEYLQSLMVKAEAEIDAYEDESEIEE